MPDRMIVNWFSPMPPLATDIANYTMVVVSALREFCDVRIWTSQESTAPLDPAWGEIHRFGPRRPPAPELLNAATLNVYNIGNNASFHRGIFEIARLTPGLLILHDTRLQHFFASYSEDPGPGRTDYYEWMQRHHGVAAREAAERFVAGELPLDVLVARYPLTGAALRGGFAAVVHNRQDAEALAGGAVPIYALPLPFARRPPRPRVPAAAGEPTRLAAFGFIGSNRRLPAILEALASMPARGAYRLDICGILEEEDAVRATIERLALSDIVTLRGFLPEAELDRCLGAADLVLNLRWPSMGEASGSQLRIWDAAAAALVTRTGWYSQLPSDAVFFVDPAHEHRDLVDHFERVRREPAAYVAAGLRGRALLERDHSPRNYAASIRAIADEIGKLQARLAASRLARRGARVMTEALGADLAHLVRDDVATHVASLFEQRVGGDVLQRPRAAGIAA